MTITTGAPPTHHTPVALARGFLTGGVIGTFLAALVVGEDTRQALTVVVQERLLSVAFAPTGTQASQFDPRSLPFARIPGLVGEATTGLGVDTPRTWQLTADGLTGSLTIRVTVTGPDGTATLEADGAGKVVRRTPAR
ncbi:hypothetical protein ACFWDQ_17520 [Streptomyces sp. NPDC060053]|uniref:hypothetical protein n=1 Tax=Streptomyces sp. NPDC060053 TaxID=3347047 RepID=UPI00368F53F0